ncbi:MAG: alpha-ketoglutarate-dependent dioxygenase AlkB [Oscillatoriales cyanobacterium C42_A2020_001]|nr:alpha-ketoglutarate-dependent dioxygenase AlkB [Leptolyngbyaceae cyanobacterium C42_A2020_001]
MQTEKLNQLALWDYFESNIETGSGTNPDVLPLLNADVRLYRAFFNTEDSDRCFTLLLTQINWQQETAHLFNQSIPLPRLTAWYGDAGKSYTYSGIEMQPNPWTEPLLAIKSAVETVANVQFNSVLLNLYRNGSDSVGWHSDAEPTLGHNPVIASVSFGATRRFSFKPKHRKGEKPVHLDLTHGSLLLMQGSTQHHWLHQVPKTTKPVGTRINLTFRVVHHP